MERQKQGGDDRPSARWPRAIIWLLLIIMSGSSAAGPHDASAEFDATADFEAGWEAGSNPSGVWSYGWSHGIDGILTLFTRNHIPRVNNNLQHMWDDPNNSFGYTPSVGRNAGGDFDNGNVTLKEGALIMHPGGTDGADFAHVIWTAPEDADFSLATTFSAQQNGINVDVHVLVNGVAVFDDVITSNGVSRTYSGTFSLAAGNTIDFAVGPNDDFGLHPGNTGLDAKIQKVSPTSRTDSETRRSRHEGIAMRATPNPFTNAFTLECDVASSPSRVQISDLMGWIVETRAIEFTDQVISLGSELPTGLYLVEILQGQERRGMFVQKVK